jgi:hypothetical protein
MHGQSPYLARELVSLLADEIARESRHPERRHAEEVRRHRVGRRDRRSR